jgi:UDP-N-acetylmuramyl pentapeptide phosphotransferase/UDP-N-acetylglucosamine-1-phosphate transferase
VAAIVALGMVTLLVVAVLVYFGIRFSKHLQRESPENDLALRLSPTGVGLCVFMVALLLLGVAARALSPDGPLGRFLQDARGIVAGCVGLSIVMLIAGLVFEKLGYPITKRGGNG